MKNKIKIYFISFRTPTKIKLIPAIIKQVNITGFLPNRSEKNVIISPKICPVEKTKKKYFLM